MGVYIKYFCQRCSGSHSPQSFRGSSTEYIVNNQWFEESFASNWQRPPLKSSFVCDSSALCAVFSLTQRRVFSDIDLAVVLLNTLSSRHSYFLKVSARLVRIVCISRGAFSERVSLKGIDGWKRGDLLMISERSFDPEDIQEGYHHKREETQGTRELLGPGQQRRRGMKCDLDIRKDFSANVTQFSGATIFRGIGEHTIRAKNTNQ